MSLVQNPEIAPNFHLKANEERFSRLAADAYARVHVRLIRVYVRAGTLQLDVERASQILDTY